MTLFYDLDAWPGDELRYDVSLSSGHFKSLSKLLQTPLCASLYALDGSGGPHRF